MTDPTDTGEGTEPVSVTALPDIPSRVYAFGVPDDIAENDEHLNEFTSAVAGLFDKADVVIFDREMDPNEADDAIEVHKLDEDDVRDIIPGGDD